MHTYVIFTVYFITFADIQLENINQMKFNNVEGKREYTIKDNIDYDVCFDSLTDEA